MLLKRHLSFSLTKLTIAEEFNSICGFSCDPRKTNYLTGYVERKDFLFSHLAGIYFSSPKTFKKLKIKIKSWLKEEESEAVFALAGYIYYLSNNFKKAKYYFLKTISLNPDNLDNWIDLAFALRHNGEYGMSRDILFNYNYIMYYYKYLKLAGCKYFKLKKLAAEIIKHTPNDG